MRSKRIVSLIVSLLLLLNQKSIGVSFHLLPYD